jgi:hypothetical protein
MISEDLAHSDFVSAFAALDVEQQELLLGLHRLLAGYSTADLELMFQMTRLWRRAAQAPPTVLLMESMDEVGALAMAIRLER